MQNRLGVPSRMVSVDEAHELSPLAGLDGVLAGAFCPLAGHATPEGAVQGYASAARAHNVRIETHTKVTELQREAVVTETGSIETECVVCAAGPWSREVAAMAGVCDTQDEWLERAEPVLTRRAPVLLDAPIAGGWWGDYEMTPDHNALIGDASAPPGRVLYATGFSGHGFQQAPAVGEIVRDLYLSRDPFVDVAPLAADRRARREQNVV